DALTRANLQQELAQLCSAEERPVTTIMITNSVEEALLLSDRIVPMTHGPRATIGRPVAVAIPKPRTLAQLAHDKDAMRSRADVFQAPCLLPWLTVRENVALAITQASPHLTRAERRARVDRYLELVGVVEAAGELPGELSLGTQQCVSLARALSVDPRFLLLDEPFSMLDSLTRFELQDTLLQVWEKHRRTVVMVTHDIDEALYLADRLILMTDGPEAG